MKQIINIPQLIVTHRFNGLDNIVFANKKLWQLAHVTKNGYFKELREIEPKYHAGYLCYRINGKRYSQQQLNAIAIKSNEIIELIKLPF